MRPLPVQHNGDDIIAFVISVWVARQLGVENYGIFTLVLWFTGIFSWAIGWLYACGDKIHCRAPG